MRRVLQKPSVIVFTKLKDSDIFERDMYNILDQAIFWVISSTLFVEPQYPEVTSMADKQDRNKNCT